MSSKSAMPRDLRLLRKRQPGLPRPHLHLNFRLSFLSYTSTQTLALGKFSPSLAYELLIVGSHHHISTEMFKASRAYTLLLLASTLATSVQAISRITRSGRYLYDESGSRFYIKGVAYQEQGMLRHHASAQFFFP